MQVPSAPPRYPGWATPVGVVLSLGFLVAAVGGPGPVLSLNVSASVLAVAIASAVVAVAAVLVLERRSYSRRRNPQPNRKKKAGNRTNSGWILGAILLTVVVLRMVRQQDFSGRTGTPRQDRPLQRQLEFTAAVGERAFGITSGVNRKVQVRIPGPEPNLNTNLGRAGLRGGEVLQPYSSGM